MNKVSKLIFFSSILLSFIFCGCPHEKGSTMNSQEICELMNRNYKGDFEVIGEEFESNDYEDYCTAYLRCSLCPEETVVTTQGYYWGPDGGWWEIIETNYYYCIYKKEIEKKVEGYIKDCFEDFDYKCVNVTETKDVMRSGKIKSLSDFLSGPAPVAASFNIVVDAHEEETKNNAASKAKQYEESDTAEINLKLRVYLYEGENFDSLTEEYIKNLDYYDSQYLFGGPVRHKK